MIRNECFAIGCHALLRQKLFCRKHWKLLDTELKRRINFLSHSKDEAGHGRYLEAVMEAKAVIFLTEPSPA